VELHLAAAALARVIQLDQWNYHLMQAEGMIPSKNLRTVEDIAKKIRRLR
jgi:hypothetical protein